jgi:hypothetical protein
LRFVGESPEAQAFGDDFQGHGDLGMVYGIYFRDDFHQSLMLVYEAHIYIYIQKQIYLPINNRIQPHISTWGWFMELATDGRGVLLSFVLL